VEQKQLCAAVLFGAAGAPCSTDAALPQQLVTPVESPIEHAYSDTLHHSIELTASSMLPSAASSISVLP